MTMSAVTRRTLADQTAHAIGRAIVNGEYLPGDDIDTAAIVKELRISRTAVREAVFILIGKGLLSARPNTGTVVRPVACWSLFDADLIGWLDASPQAKELADDAAEFAAFLDGRPSMEGNALYAYALRVLGTADGGS